MRGEGKNDPRRPLYWILLGFSEDESIEKSKLEKRKCSPRCVEYWLKKDLLNALKLESIFNSYFKHSYTPTLIKTTECFEYTDKNIETTLKILEEFKNG